MLVAPPPTCDNQRLSTHWQKSHPRLRTTVQGAPVKRNSKPRSWGPAGSYIWLQSLKLCLLCPLKNQFKRLEFDLCLHRASTNSQIPRVSVICGCLPDSMPFLPLGAVECFSLVVLDKPHIVTWTQTLPICCMSFKIHLKCREIHRDGDSYLWLSMARLSVLPVRSLMSRYTMDSVINRGLRVKLLFSS